MSSNPIQHWRNFREDVDREVTFLVTQYREDAYAMALKALAKPNLRTRRRKVLAAAARILDPTPRLFGVFKLKPLLGGRRPPPHRSTDVAL